MSLTTSASCQGCHLIPLAVFVNECPMALSTATVVSSGHEELAIIPVQCHQALRMEPEGELGEGGESDSISGDLSG